MITLAKYITKSCFPSVRGSSEKKNTQWKHDFIVYFVSEILFLSCNFFSLSFT